jgi:CubicO group peptidase (beta-lactamase class C family)
MSVFPRHLTCLWLGFLTLAGPLRTGFAEPRPVAASQTPQMLREADLGAFFDGVIAGQLAAYQVPGAAVAVVQAGRLPLSRGYGVADLRTGRPVSAERTLFRAGSVSKVFTATAVMQLVEQGRLDLGADVNPYLDGLQVPETFPEPITLGHLLTQTAGFKDHFFGLFAADVTTSLPLDSYVSRYQPVRVRPPGQVSAHYNYSAALAGHIVARVSGRPFEK